MRPLLLLFLNTTMEEIKLLWKGQGGNGEENHASCAAIAKTPGREKGCTIVKKLAAKIANNVEPG